MTTISPSKSPQESVRSGQHMRSWPVIAVGLLAVGLALSACGSNTNSSTAATPTPSPTTALSTSSALIATASSPLGTILVDNQGRTVYMFAADSPGKSTCTGSCLAYWPIVKASASVPKSVAGVQAKIGSIKRVDGGQQLTVNGWPVYTYTGDSSAGMTSGQGLNASGGLWWVLAPSGNPVTATASSPSSSSPSPSTSRAVGY